MYERILVPTDGSAGVERAVEHAIDLATTHGATIHAVYVVNTASYGGIPMETSWDGIRDVLSDEGQAALERVRTLAEAAEVEAEAAVLDGSPSRQIVNYAEEADCDLIVMGTHGRGGLDRLLLGSVAERVVRSSEIPVLTVRVGEPPDAEERTASEASSSTEESVEPAEDAP
ncbi:universal stress protein uspa-like protein [Salinarchaeum sp. Harcht-Bsk1]|uniref:universal stress protein n=1 Tax=Salinarchaeum sp. Harcht-Bsk1 TaxID=1333523 RepID=UPI00034228C7|nr:universal stress protein [Salinarchaeum sp. Harcht-Bsk1]AGN02633.1 universal stress protein uspa-like protein [Salinarchaeum sp. Harcht-Bsk1]